MKRVLIVDDGAFMRILIRGMLERNGYEIAGEAENGEDAVEKYQELKPDLVTMDITMPVKDGIAALQEIIALDGEASVLMVSAMGQEQNVKQALLSGAKGFVTKPFDESGFIAVLESLE